jgi:hypothetical protein
MSSLRRTGATLVAMPLSLFVIGLSLIVAFQGLGRSGWRDGAERVSSHEIRSSADRLRRQFAELTPLRRLDGHGGGAAIAFEGDTHVVRFVAPAPDDIDGAGLVVVAVTIERYAGAVDVWHVIASLDPGADRWSETRPGRRSLLIGGLEDATIAYFGAPNADDDVEWRAEWPRDAAQFPEAVRLSIVSQDGDDSWPDFYFRIPAARPL